MYVLSCQEFPTKIKKSKSANLRCADLLVCMLPFIIDLTEESDRVQSIAPSIGILQEPTYTYNVKGEPWKVDSQDAGGTRDAYNIFI